jgi:hypothetical protein
MVRSSDCLAKFGEPVKENPWLVLWDVPADLHVGVIPKRIYCNRLLIDPLQAVFINLISRGYAESELNTWDGCFNIRQTTGGESWSLHSWGVAIDVNALENGYNRPPKLSPGFVECFTDAGFDWGGSWHVPDGMHFQLANI